MVFEFAHEMLSRRQLTADKKITADMNANGKDGAIKANKANTQDKTDKADSEGITNTADGPDTSVIPDSPAATAIPLNLNTHKTSNAPDIPNIPGSSSPSRKSDASDTNGHDESPLDRKTQGSKRTDNERPNRIWGGTMDNEIMEWVNVTYIPLMPMTKGNGEISQKNK